MDHSFYTIMPLHYSVTTWKQLEQAYVRMAKTEDERIAFQELINFYKTELGKGFFNTCGYNHPLSIKLTMNLHHWNELLDFTYFLRRLKEDDHNNYIQIVKKLKPRKKCQAEGIPFTDVYRMFGKTGFKVNILEESGFEPTADIQLFDLETKDSIFIEVSQLLLSNEQSSIQEQHRQLSEAFLLYGYDLPKACKQLKNFDKLQMEKTLAKIRELKDEAAAKVKCCSYEDDFIKFAVSHIEKIHELDKWCKLHQMERNSVSGLEIRFDDTPRLVNNKKIIGEIKQLPRGKPGLVYLPVSSLYFWTMDKAETAIAIMKQLESYPDCLGIILFVATVGTLSNLQRLEDEYFIIGVSEKNGIYRHIFYVGNPWFTGSVSESTLKRFRNSLY